MIDHNPSNKSEAGSKQRSTNTIDIWRKDLIILSRLPKNKEEELIKLLNAHAGNVHENEIMDCVGLKSNASAYNFKMTIALMAHEYLHHKEQFLKRRSHAKTDVNVVNHLFYFLEKLSKKALEGLNLNFVALGTLQGWSRISRVSDGSVQLKEILDEEDNLLGYLPFVKFRISFRDEENNVNSKTVFIPLDRLRNIIEGFQAMHDNAVEIAKRYQKHIDLTILS